jgi:hypothetical protein
MRAIARNGTLELNSDAVVWTGRVEVGPIHISLAEIKTLSQRLSTPVVKGEVTISTADRTLTIDYLDNAQASFSAILAAIRTERPDLALAGKRRGILGGLLGR